MEELKNQTYKSNKSTVSKTVTRTKNYNIRGSQPHKANEVVID
jgi:hypothetical protein